MNSIDNLKFTTEDNKEYVLLVHKFIDGFHYGYAINLNDEFDSMYVKILIQDNNISFEVINDKNIINVLIKSLSD